MLRAYDFSCPTHGRFEEFLTERVESHPCPKCGEASSRIQFAAPLMAPKYIVAAGDVRKRARN